MRTDRGGITAELVVVLPVIFATIALAIGGVGVQLQRMQLISSANSLAQMIARSESPERVDLVIRNLGDVSFEIEESGELVCVVLKSRVRLAQLDLGELELIERGCARAVGL